MELDGVTSENSQGMMMMTMADRESIPDLLALARQRISEGNPSLALQAVQSLLVVMAMKSFGGESAVLQTLCRARELYQSRMQTTAAAEELASLFAECAITEASPNAPARPSAFNDCHSSGSSMVSDASETSILAKSGRIQVVMDAFADGSSFICLQCGGLVSNLRRDEHLAYWCCRAS